MLKLKYLFDNPHLATMAVKKWVTITETPESFQYFRISSNAIYPFEMDEGIYYLRLTPVEENNEEQIQAELDYLSYLSNMDYSVVESVQSKDGNLLECMNTPWGMYFATVFKRVLGKQLSDYTLTDDLAFGWGESLGKLHRLSQQYATPSNKRESFQEKFTWMRETLNDFYNHTEAKEELAILEPYFHSLKITDDNFGLIHYDFEADNVFYDEETNRFTPIDFDDSMYHFYVMDVERTINSIKEEFEGVNYDHYKDVLIQGYQSMMPLTEEMVDLMPIMTRFANLYSYVRVLRSTNEQWEHEPSWMLRVRNHINNRMKQYRKHFGKPIK